MNDILLLLGEDVHFIFGVFQPRMAQYFNCTKSFARINLKQLVNEVGRMLG